MLVNYNGHPVTALSEGIPDMQRAIQYGDSLFETIRMFDGKMPFLHRHIHRLKNGMDTIGIDVPEEWDLDFFEQQIAAVATGNARIRFTVWRSPGGLYLPQNNTPMFMVTAVPMETGTYLWPDKPVTVGICQKVKLPVDEFSNLKTLNAPRYIQAALEAQKNGWDDGILLNQFNHVCEATSSNIFWWNEDGDLFTPPLTAGCVAGVMRYHVIATAKKMGILVNTKETTTDHLRYAPEIFLTNAVRGVLPAILAGSPNDGWELTEDLWKKLW